jgi:hypothetical protein
MSRIAHPVEVDKVINIAQARCEDLGVQVKYDHNAKGAYTDGHCITLPMVGQPITADALDTLYGQIIHETGHHLRDEAFKILKAAKPPAHLAHLYNIVEDDGMERERALEWRGDAKALSIMNDILVRELTDTWQEEANLEDSNPEPLACLAINQLSRLEWDTVSDSAAQQFIKHMPDKVKDLIAELESEGWVNRIRATKTEHDTWDVAVDLAKRLYPDDEEQQDEYEEIREQGHSMAGERDDSDSSFDDAQSKQNSRPDGKDSLDPLGEGEDEDGDGSGEASTGEGRTVGWEHCVVSEHSKWNKEAPGGPLGITWEGRVPTGGVALAPTNLINVVDMQKSKASTSGGGYWRRGWQDYMPTDEHSRMFANKIRRYIQSQARSVVRKDREHGKIDRGNLYRLAMPMIDGGEWNKKVFYDQRKHTMKDTAIFVLVDWSGSMMGMKMKFAADAAQRLVWCFDRVLNVPVALAAFSDRQSFCDIGYIKKYNTRGMDPKKIAEGFARFGSYTSGNNDADAVNWAYTQVLRRKESRKILIVCSDGAPAGAWKGHADEALQYCTAAIEKDYRVELYGLGIRDHSVSRYYTNHQVVQDVHDISPALFNMIKDGDKT